MNRRSFLQTATVLGGLALNGNVRAAHATPSVRLRPAPPITFPGGYNCHFKRFFLEDCKSPLHWDGNTLYVFNSWMQPFRSAGPDLFHLSRPEPVRFNDEGPNKLSIWFEGTYCTIESTCRDDNATLYGWFHNEVWYECPPRKNAIAPGYPSKARIGALRSKDNGLSWDFLGFIFEPSPATIRCDTESSWYTGGEGDFDVILDSRKEYIYFYFTNYTSIFADQGICVARMKFADRDDPRGKVFVFYNGEWNEPALGGRATPVFPASVDLTRRDGQTFWGPAIHWNTYLEQYAMVLNRAKDTLWTTEGIYISFSHELGNPEGWSKPQKMMDREEAIHEDVGIGWYGEQDQPAWHGQVVGTGRGETNTLAGRVARFFLQGESKWEIEFER